MIRLERTESTNSALRALAMEGAAHGEAVLAWEQSAGRGRLGRRWLTAPGEAVLLSVLVRRPLPAARVPLLTLAAAVAVAECLPGLGIKWPNDLLAPDGRKVAGILAEAEFDKGYLDFAVIGVGLNVHGAPSLPEATCLDACLPQRAYEVDDLAAQIRDALLAACGVLERDPASILSRWRSASATLGRVVQIGLVRGVALDVEPDGALLVQTDAGPRRVLAGDVQLVATPASR